VNLLSQAFAWIGANEAVLSGIAAAIVIVGVLSSPLRRRFSRRGARDPVDANESQGLERDPELITDRPSIAVLPFANLSGEPDHEFLADGLTEDIITGLSRVKQFFVIARNTTFTYKGRPVDVQEVSRALGVRYVLEGSVRATGERIRITAQLIDATTRAHAWAERFDRPLADILAVDDEVTEAIVAALQPALRRAEIESSRSADPKDLGAWALVNRAWVSIQSDLGDEERASAAVKACEEAIALDRDYALAHAVLAYARSLSAGQLPPSPADEGAMASMRRALELAPDDASVQHAYAAMLGNLGRTADAIRAWERSLDLNPNNAAAKAGLGIAQIYLARHSEAIANIETALRLSPSDPLLYHWLAHRALACVMLARWDEALESAADSVHRNGSRVGWATYAGALAHAGRLEEAGWAWKALRERTPGVSADALAAFLRSVASDPSSALAAEEAMQKASDAEAAQTS
jgi:TolB-like protein/Tfp pilus assembly protein PilF